MIWRNKLLNDYKQLSQIHYEGEILAVCVFSGKTVVN